MESGIALALLLIIAGLLTQQPVFYRLSAAAIIISLSFPVVFKPFAFLWFGFARLLGAVTSRILLATVFIVMIVPVAWFRRLSGKDSLLIKQFKKSNRSVFKERNSIFTPDQLEKTY